MKYAAFLLSALTASVALAQTPPGCELARTDDRTSAGSEAIVALLSRQETDALETHLQRRMDAIAAGQDTDLMLLRDLDLVFSHNPQLREAVQNWVNSRPSSFAARLVATVHHRIEGHRLRGSRFASETSAAQFEAMRREFATAMQHANRAADIHPRSALPQIATLSMAANMGGQTRVTATLADALKADPLSIGARAVAMNYLTPRWGGQLAQVNGVLEEARRAGLPDGHLQYLAFTAAMEHGSHWWAVDKQPQRALAAYEDAWRRCPNSVRALDGLLANAYLLKHWDTIIRVVDHAEQTGPVTGTVYRRRAQAHEGKQDLSLAIADLQRAASMGDGWSAGQLGHMHARGEHLPKDWTKARRLLTEASAQGLAFARRELEWLDQQEAQAGRPTQSPPQASPAGR